MAYIADTGIDITHPDFGGRAIFGFSAFSGKDDGHGHGTHCAGTVGSDSYGIAKRVDLVAVKVLNDRGSGSTGDIIEGLEWILSDHNKRGGKGNAKSVVNMSLGGSPSDAEDDVINQLIDQGIVVVAAAGTQNI